MKLLSLIALLAAFAMSVQAQEALLALAKVMPTCSLTCFTELLPSSACATDLTSECMCTNKALNDAVAVCSMQACTAYELLQTKNVTSSACGAPVRDEGAKFITIAMVGIVLAVLAFILRMAASIGAQGRPLSWDDATMGFVLLLAIPPSVFAPLLVQNGLGRDMWTLKDWQITNVLFYYYLGEVFYVVALGISKISILFFYLRVFPAKEFRMLTYSVMGLSAAYTIAFLFATVFQCLPVTLAWTQWDGLHSGFCSDINIQGWVAAAINIALDLAVMVLPLKYLAHLNMNIKKKLMVMSMFSVGIFVVIVSALRLYSLVHFANTHNPTWDYVGAGYWSLLEIDVSVVCGCMPAHRALIIKAWPRIKTSFHSMKTSSAQASSSKGSKFSSNTSSTGDKLNKISVKPKSGDESDFVPLVDVDTKNARLENHSESDGTTWANQNFTTNVNYTDTSTQDFPSTGSHRSYEWPIASPTTGKEHV